MKKINILVVGLLLVFNAQSQNIDKLIKEKEVRRIETILAADDMQGRRTFTPGIEKAAAFIADEFKATGLKTLNNSGSYLQSFAEVKWCPKHLSNLNKLFLIPDSSKLSPKPRFHFF